MLGEILDRARSAFHDARNVWFSDYDGSSAKLQDTGGTQLLS